MSSNKPVSEKSKKVQMIIQASQNRFGLYGIEKTTMQEIANDLKLSKASLYYYFHDKESLYNAVIKKEQAEFLDKISKRILNFHEPEQLLLEYANARLSYFRTLLNLSRLKLDDYSNLKPAFRKTMMLFKEKEKEIILKIFEKGTDKGIFFIKNPDATASLFLDLLKGLRLSVVNDKKTLFIDQEEFDQILKNTNSFTEIFINGLKFKQKKKTLYNK